uniref:Uncharacterized protein n=1 Tax=Alexandrium catenella TaxID=2925 RepID=A0A7S1MS31_ALECA
MVRAPPRQEGRRRLSTVQAAAALVVVGVAANLAHETVLVGLTGFRGPASSRSRLPGPTPRELSCARLIQLTGKSRPCPPTPQYVWPKLEDEDKRDLKWGWDSEKGKWFDLKASGIKWWQRPGYLTPNGYRQPPHWNVRDYALCVEELKFARWEAHLTGELKKRGMSIEEIRAKASVYEFLENPKLPKMTGKMLFLMQVKCLHSGRGEELIDLSGIDANTEGGGEKPNFRPWPKAKDKVAFE